MKVTQSSTYVHINVFKRDHSRSCIYHGMNNEKNTNDKNFPINAISIYIADEVKTIYYRNSAVDMTED